MGPRIRTAFAFLLAIFPAIARGADFESQRDFPFALGNFWQYRQTGGALSTESLASVEVVGGQETFLSVVSGGARSGDTENLSNGPEGLRIRRLYEVGAGGGTLVFSPPVVVAPAQASIGAVSTGTGAVSAVLTGLGSYSLGYQSKVTVAARENREVPLGSFDAVKVVSEITIAGFVPGVGAVSVPIRDTHWYAQGMGPVEFSSLESKLIATNVPEATSVALDLGAVGAMAFFARCTKRRSGVRL